MQNASYLTAKSRHYALLLWLAATSMALSGCVAALVPIAAGGLLAKTQLDARKRARQAEATMEQPNGKQEDAPQVNTEQASGAPITISRDGVPPQGEVAGEPKAMRAAERLLFSNVRHPYLAFTLYALDQAEKRASGLPLRSAVLIENISLANPKAIDCGNKRFAVIIDLDEAKGGDSPANITASDLAVLLETLREADIRIAWLSGDTQAAAQGRIAALQSGETPALKENDLLLLGRKGGLRKQEQRWELAKDHCVLAVAGDRKADFDELYDYLRKPDLAIRLDAFTDRGWFELPAPTRALGAGDAGAVP
jgi:hypothetical protein